MMTEIRRLAVEAEAEGIRLHVGEMVGTEEEYAVLLAELQIQRLVKEGIPRAVAFGRVLAEIRVDNRGPGHYIRGVGRTP